MSSNPSHHRLLTYPFLPVLVLLLLPVLSTPALAFSELQNRSLHGCVLLENPYVIQDPTRNSGYTGIAITYLDLLEEHLKFTITLSLWNNSFSKFIDVMSTCDPDSAASEPCPCDIGIGSFTMTNERAEKITFVWPFSNEAHRMISRKSDLKVDDSNSFSFLFKAFSPTVWVIIAFGIFLHAVGTMFFGPFRPSTNTHPTTYQDSSHRSAQPSPSACSDFIWRIKRFPAACLYAFATLLGQPFGEAAQSTPSFHRTAWLLLGVTTGLFLITVYQASLTVLLFESTTVSPFRTLSDFTDCNLDPSRVAIIAGGASQDFWNNAVNTSHFREKCSWDSVGMTVPNLEEGFRFVANGNADYFYSLQGSVLFRSYRNCKDFQAVGEPFFSTSVAFVLPKKTDQSLLDTLSRETRILREQDGYPSASLVAARNSCESEVDATITSGRLVPFFVLYVVVWGFLVLYRCIFLWKRKRRPAKVQNNASDGNDIIVMNMHSMPTRSMTGVEGIDGNFDPFYPELPQGGV